MPVAESLERGVYPRLAVVALVRDSSVTAKWLLIRTRYAPRLWAPVGGRVLPGEGLAQAAVREVGEEVDLDVEAVGPCYAALVPHKGELTLAVSIACRTATVTPDCRTAEEALDFRWVFVEEWISYAARGRSPWTPTDVTRGTRLAATLLGL